MWLKQLSLIVPLDDICFFFFCFFWWQNNHHSWSENHIFKSGFKENTVVRFLRQTAYKACHCCFSIHLSANKLSCMPKYQGYFACCQCYSMDLVAFYPQLTIERENHFLKGYCMATWALSLLMRHCWKVNMMNDDSVMASVVWSPALKCPLD